jgi:hypothetical protein
MDLPASEKRFIFDFVIRRIGRTFRIIPMGEHAAAIAERRSHVSGVLA